MGKLQVQYPSIAEPPGVPAAVAVAEMGWRPQYPQLIQPFSDRRDYRTRGGGFRSPYDTQSHAVVVPEQWAIPGNKIGTFYGPDNPQQVSDRREYRLRGGGYRGLSDTQSHAVFAIEQWTTPKGAAYEGPDNPQQFWNRRDVRARGGGYRAALDPSIAPQDYTQPATTTVSYAPMELPDDPRLGRRLQLTTAAMLDAMADGWAAQDAPLAWSVEYPDTVSRRALTAGVTSSVCRGEAIEQFDRDLLASATYVDTTIRTSLTTAQQRHAITGTAPENWTVPPVSWVGTWPSATLRARLPTSEQLTHVSGTSPEVWNPPALSWRPSIADRIPTLRPQTRIEGHSFALRDVVTIVPALSWAGWLPERTKRAALASGLHPSTFRGEAIEQFARILLASVQAPDATRRPTRPAAAAGAFLLPMDAAVLAYVPATFTDIPRRRRVATSSAIVRAETVEEFRLLARVTAPDRYSIQDRRIMMWPSLSALLTDQTAPLVIDARGWYGSAPDRVWSSKLPVAILPWLHGRGENPIILERLSATLAITQAVRSTLMLGGAMGISDNWAVLSQLPVAITGHTVLDFGGSLWIFGATFDPDADVSEGQKVFRSDDEGATWTEVGDNALPVDVLGHCACVFDNKMWLLGGIGAAGPSDAVYSTTDGRTWTREGTLPAARYFAACVVHQGQMCLMGGIDTATGYTLTILGSSDGAAWPEVGTFPTFLRGMAAVVFEDNVLVFGGTSDAGVPSQQVYAGATVSALGQLGQDALPYAADLPLKSVVVHDGQIWIVGGINNGTRLDTVFRSVAVHPSQGILTWEAVSSLPVPVGGGAAVSLEDAILLTGGAGADGSSLRSVYSFAARLGPPMRVATTLAITQQLSSTEEL